MKRSPLVSLLALLLSLMLACACAPASAEETAIPTVPPQTAADGAPNLAFADGFAFGMARRDVSALLPRACDDSRENDGLWIETWYDPFLTVSLVFSGEGEDAPLIEVQFVCEGLTNASRAAYAPGVCALLEQRDIQSDEIQNDYEIIEEELDAMFAECVIPDFQPEGAPTVYHFGGSPAAITLRLESLNEGGMLAVFHGLMDTGWEEGGAIANFIVYQWLNEERLSEFFHCAIDRYAEETLPRLIPEWH